VRLLVYLAGIALVLIVIAALVLVSVPRSRRFQAAGPPTPNHGTAHYAMGSIDTGFSVTVESVQRDVAIPQLPTATAGSHAVLVAIRFANTSSSQQRADWHDFALRNSIGQEHPPVFAPGTPCQEWPMTDLVPPEQQSRPQRDTQAQRAGTSFGPVPLCFEAAGSPQDTLTLVWDPDVSFPLLDSPTEIPLVSP
jgi:hypothetical protein